MPLLPVSQINSDLLLIIDSLSAYDAEKTVFRDERMHPTAASWLGPKPLHKILYRLHRFYINFTCCICCRHMLKWRHQISVTRL